MKAERKRSSEELKENYLPENWKKNTMQGLKKIFLPEN